MQERGRDPFRGSRGGPANRKGHGYCIHVFRYKILIPAADAREKLYYYLILQYSHPAGKRIKTTGDIGQVTG